MQRLFTTLALTLALGLSAAEATALGFARISSSAVLGQPLDITVELKLDTGESFAARCAKAEVSFGERALPDAVVRVRVETSSTTGARRLRITTTVPVDEPVVAVQVQAGCPSTLSRNFVLFADPPGRTAAVREPADEAWQADRGETAVSPVIAAVPPSAQASAPPIGRVRTRRDAAATAGPDRSATAVARPQATPRGPSRKQAAAGESRPVLRLDPVEADALILPSLQMDTRLSTPDPAASGVNRALDPEQAQRLQDLERLKAMEAALLKLRSDSQATEKSLTDMQLRLRQAEASRYDNPLVYLLLGLCALLGAGLLGMWWLRRRDRAAAIWWSAQPEANAPPVPPTAPPVPMSAPSTFVSELAPLRSPPPVPNFPAAPLAPLSPPSPATGRPHEPEVGGAEPRRPMSAEELIDLEQQAEFFVVLGQDDAAIDLLMGHVRSTGGVSPLPYLKLLEIYRRRGERDPYDRIRERFNRRFNAYAPEWDVDPEEGLSLEGYPEVMSKLQNAWESPSRAMELLDGALFKRNAGPTFDVPAYRELLFLYGMARDLAERDVGPEGVDLLLPLDDEAPPSMMSSVPASPAAPAPSDDEIGSFSLDLDVSSDPPPRLSLDDDPHFKRNDR